MRKVLLSCCIVLLAACAGRGPEVRVRSYLQPIERDDSLSVQGETVLALRTTPGEFEPGCFTVRSMKESSLEITITGAGDTALPSEWCRLYRVTARADSAPLNRLLPLEGQVTVKSGVTGYFWLDVCPPEDAAPGVYSGKITVSSAEGTTVLPLSVEVLPFHLEDSAIRDGAFMWLVDLPPGWFADMKQHGLDAIQYFTWEWEMVDHEQDRSAWSWDPSTIKIANRDGRLEMDFQALDRVAEGMQAAGMDGPLVVSLGNDHFLHYECALARAFGLKVDTSAVMDGKAIIAPEVSPKLDQLFAEGLKMLHEHWDSKGFTQELVILIYDEPTERLLDRCKNRYDLLKKTIPGTRVYGVVMNRREWAEQMADQCDVIVSNGDFEGCREVAEKYGKDFWVYSFPLQAVHTSRWDMGFLPWRVGAGGAFFWMYNYWFYSPDYCAVYPLPSDPNRVVSSTGWAGVREGVDDLRYLATLDKAIQSAPPEKQTSAREGLAAIRDLIDPEQRAPAASGEAQDEVSRLAHFNEPQRLRGLVIEMILDLREQAK